MLYYVPQSSCYLKIIKVLFVSEDYTKARVRWYSRPGRTLLHEEKLKIPLEAMRYWRVLKENQNEKL